jgi:hypothetical protein
VSWTVSLSTSLVLVSESFVTDNLEALVSLQSVTILARGSDASVNTLNLSQRESILALSDNTGTVRFSEVFWALGIFRLVALLVLEFQSSWAGLSDAFVSDSFEVVWTGFDDALVDLPGVAFLTVGVTSSESKSESFVTSLSDALAINRFVVLVLASLQDTGLFLSEFESFTFTGSSDTGGTVSFESGSALDLVALSVLLAHRVTLWTSLSDTFTVLEVEVLGTERSDALTLNGLESDWADFDTARSFELVTLLARLVDALVSNLGESGWASSQGAFTVDVLVSLVANNLVALSISQFVSGGTSDSDTGVTVLLVVLWALFEFALTLNFLVSNLTWRDTVSGLSELETFVTSLSLALGTDLLVVSWA